jgi:hypothetical protein
VRKIECSNSKRVQLYDVGHSSLTAGKKFTKMSSYVCAKSRSDHIS